MHHLTTKKISLALFGILTFISTFIKLSPVLGSFKFSLTSVGIMLPLIGGFANLPAASLFIVAYGLYRVLRAVGAATFGIPLFFATANWNIQTAALINNSRKINIARFFMNVVVPIICMTLFVAHPVGGQAFVYASFWLIPICLYILQMFNFHNIFSIALGSTFIAHGIGSVMWIYMVPMTAEQWIALMPLALAERLTMAAASSIIFMGIQKTSTRLNNIWLTSKKTV
ncbi:hypothetical protein IPF37_01170 [bacterium]|nr:MAG: hypothetical protein IPF37_01170 [bacterium]